MKILWRKIATRPELFLIGAAIAAPLAFFVFILVPPKEERGKIQNIEKIIIHEPGDFTVWYYEGTYLKHQRFEHAKLVNVQHDVPVGKPRWIYYVKNANSHALRMWSIDRGIRAKDSYSYVEVHNTDRSNIQWEGIHSGE
jgi:hypothetical protein